VFHIVGRLSDQALRSLHESMRLLVYLHLLFGCLSDYQQFQLRFLREENRILRSRLHQSRLILSTEDRKRVMSVCEKLDHRVDGLISAVTYRTYRRWLRERQKEKTTTPSRPPQEDDGRNSVTCLFANPSAPIIYGTSKWISSVGAGQI